MLGGGGEAGGGRFGNDGVCVLGVGIGREWGGSRFGNDDDDVCVCLGGGEGGGEGRFWNDGACVCVCWVGVGEAALEMMMC